MQLGIYLSHTTESLLARFLHERKTMFKKIGLILIVVTALSVIFGAQCFAASKYDRAKAIYKHLKDKDFTTIGACALIGNCDVESGLSPTIQGPGGYFGICQWGGGRKHRLLKYWKRPKTVKTQIKYFHWECKEHYYSSFKKIKKAKSWKKAMTAISEYAGASTGFNKKIKRGKYWKKKLA